MIHIQSYRDSKNRIIPMWDFGLSAQFACAQECKDYLLLEDEETIGRDSDCLIGSVEWCSNYLRFYNYPVPSAIDIFLFSEFTGRKMWKATKKELIDNCGTFPYVFPIFCKPFDKIKSFTGTQLLNKFDAELVLKDVSNDDVLCMQNVVDYVSEWRVYVNRKRIVRCKQYRGHHLYFPEKDVIDACLEHAISILPNVSFTLDFAVDNLSRTYLIEPNDGWAIANYGLEPLDYLNFCTDRWKQITGKL